MNKTKGIGINEPVCLIHRDLWDHEKGQPLSKGESAHTPRETKDHIRNSRDTWEQVALKAAAERDRLREQRDELLAACKLVNNWMPRSPARKDQVRICKVIRDAIAKAEWQPRHIVDSPDSVIGCGTTKHTEGAKQ